MSLNLIQPGIIPTHSHTHKEPLKNELMPEAPEAPKWFSSLKFHENARNELNTLNSESNAVLSLVSEQFIGERINQK